MSRGQAPKPHPPSETEWDKAAAGTQVLIRATREKKQIATVEHVHAAEDVVPLFRYLSRKSRETRWKAPISYEQSAKDGISSQE